MGCLRVAWRGGVHRAFVRRSTQDGSGMDLRQEAPGEARAELV